MSCDVLDLDAVTRHLEAHGIRLAGPLTAELIAGGRSNLTFRLSDGHADWALRRPPTAGQTASAHDMVREARVMKALAGSAVPVPYLVSLCEDESVLGVPFTMTEWMDGLVVRERTQLDEFSDTEIATICDSLIDALVALHAVDPAEVGLSDLGRPTGYLDRQVALWRRQWEQVQTRNLPGVDLLHDRLASRVPHSATSSIVHGDFRIDNAMLAVGSPGTVVALLDWELSTLGDPNADVALMCTYRHHALDTILGIPAAWTSSRLPSAEALAQSYFDSSGRDAGDWAFYLGLAHFKLAVIAEGIAYRARAGADAGRGALDAADAVPELIAMGVNLVS